MCQDKGDQPSTSWLILYILVAVVLGLMEWRLLTQGCSTGSRHVTETLTPPSDVGGGVLNMRTGARRMTFDFRHRMLRYYAMAA